MPLAEGASLGPRPRPARGETQRTWGERIRRDCHTPLVWSAGAPSVAREPLPQQGQRVPGLPDGVPVLGDRPHPPAAVAGHDPGHAPAPGLGAADAAHSKRSHPRERSRRPGDRPARDLGARRFPAARPRRGPGGELLRQRRDLAGAVLRPRRPDQHGATDRPRGHGLDSPADGGRTGCAGSGRDPGGAAGDHRRSSATKTASSSSPTQDRAVPGMGFEQSRMAGVNIYAMLVERVVGRRPVRVQLLYLSKPEAIIAYPTEQKVRAVEKRTAALWSAVERACGARRLPAPARKALRLLLVQALLPGLGRRSRPGRRAAPASEGEPAPAPPPRPRRGTRRGRRSQPSLHVRHCPALRCPCAEDRRRRRPLGRRTRRSRTLDQVFFSLSAAADHSILWHTIGAVRGACQPRFAAKPWSWPRSSAASRSSPTWW